MDILLIGGTGNISLSVTKQLLERGDRVTLLNRGNHPLPAGAESLIADIRQEEETARKLEGRHFDAVCDFIAFETADVERDRRLFGGKTGQYVFVSTASAYQKPARDYRITEGVALYNPHWAYSRKKAACEEYLMQQYRENGFPVTVVRPSHTYGPEKVPVGIHGSKGSWQVLRRMLDGKPVLIPGDGTSLWTLTASDDFARGFVGLLGNPRAIGEAFHITSDEALTWDQIHGLIADALGVPLKAYHVASDFLAAVSPYDLEGALLGDKAYSVVFDNTKLKRAVPAFRAEIPACRGIREAVANLLADPARQTADPEFDAWCDRVIEALENAKEVLRR